MPKKSSDNVNNKIPKRNNNNNKHKLPVPLPNGLILTDITKRQWKLGKSIGVGGFGEIYLVTDNVSTVVGADAPFVVKIEPHSNGPLFAEIHCLCRIGKPESSSVWYQGEKYRFMVMERYGEDLHKVFESKGKILSVQMVFNVGIKVLHVLEYIHSHGYIHADIKGSNLLLGWGKGRENEVYLIDFGLACRYESQGSHKEYVPDIRFAHDGTIEYTSRDAHIGGDLEILGYNMLHWLHGHLPWEVYLQEPEKVHACKKDFMENVSHSLKQLFGTKPPAGASVLETFLQYVKELNFKSQPDYKWLCQLLQNGLKKEKCIIGPLLVSKARNTTSSACYYVFHRVCVRKENLLKKPKISMGLLS